MKTKKAEIPVIAIMTVIAVVLAGVIAIWFVNFTKDKKQDLNSGSEKVDNAISKVADFDLLAYDGYTIKGENLRELITDVLADELQLSIGVTTLALDTKYYNFTFTPATATTKAELGTKHTTATAPSLTDTKSDNSYITPSGNFKGQVITNDNDEIICILFTQQK